MYRCSLLSLVHIFLFFGVHTSLEASSLQVSPTVTLESEVSIFEGAIVISEDDTGQYGLSENAHSSHVFGVVAARPALVFSTGADKVPVITEGVGYVQVSTSGGVIGRGDLLVTSSSTGVARLAKEGEGNVFAIALEDYTEGSGQIVGLLQAEIGTQRAQALLASAQTNHQEGGSENVEEQNDISLLRASIAAVLAVGSLFFILYSFRSVIAQGVISIGRNPRARRSILTLAFGNIVFALILFSVVIFVSVAILVLPL